MRRRSLEVAVVFAFAILLVSRSVLLPSWASQVAPLLAGLLIFAGSLPYLQRFRVPSSAILVGLLVAVYVAASAASGVTDNFVKSLSIGFLWFVAFLVAANVEPNEKSRFFKLVLVAAVLELAIAVGETLIGLPSIRSMVAATQDGIYTVRPNTILGAWTNRAQGTIGYPIPLAHFFALGLAIVVFAHLGLSIFNRWLAAILLFAGILLTGTRSGVAAALASLAAGLLVSRRGEQSKLRIWLLVLLATAALLGVLILMDQENLSTDGSFTHRVGVLTSIGEIVRLPAERVLFGSGLNSHESLFELGYLGTSGTFAVDNGFITLLIYTGVVGLVSFLVVTGRALGHGTPDEVSVLVGSLTFSMTYDFINWHLHAALFFAMAGLTFSRQNTFFDTDPKVSVINRSEA
ncbi:O-antigen ligase family protein [Arthrobacter sp. NPDC058097]|uniref:O-antigen ligase family protein n=1 Tax=Arthrobacter sp. NPDC058097 TaxID=3346340 RepID=UPI0036DDA52E